MKKVKKLTSKQKKKLENIKNYKNSNQKQHLTIDEQIGKLKSINFTIDIDINLAKNYLSEESYAQFFKSYEDIFIKWEDDISYDFNINKKSEITDIFKYLKINRFKYHNNNKFSDLIKIKHYDKELREFLLTQINRIELIIKNELCNFIGVNKKDKNWTSWLIEISPKDYLSEVLNIVSKPNTQIGSHYHIIHNLSLGKLRNIIWMILKSETIDTKIIKQFCKTLFLKNLGKVVYFSNKNWENDLIWKLTYLNNIRNYVAHSERFGTFLLKERLFRLQHVYSNDEFKFTFVKLTEVNKTMKHLTRFTFDEIDNIPLGYLIKLTNKFNNSESCLESNIIKDFIWWFK